MPRRCACIAKETRAFTQADDDAQYAAVHQIDLSEVDSMVALFPSPDNGVCACVRVRACVRACVHACVPLYAHGQTQSRLRLVCM